MTRRDYLNDPNAPKVNSIVVAVSVFIQDEFGRILMIRRTDNDLYSIPGGQVEPGETLAEGAVREVKEETGFDSEVVELVGLYSDPRHVIEYDDGEVRQEFSICFRGSKVGGKARTSDESSEIVWIAHDELPKINVHPSIMRRIGHALSGRSHPYFT